MKKKILLAAAFISVFGFQLSAQNNDPVILEVGGQQIRQSEFMKDFRLTEGNNLAKNTGITEAEKRAALNEYTELYANFRAKYLDAVEQGLDTAFELRRELNRYRKDLAAPYLIDSAALSALLREAYERNHYMLHAAHILVRVEPDAAPADTLEAYNHIMELRNRILAGEDFFEVAREETLRRDPNAQVYPNEGELNCFTVFDMVYPFENGAYALKEGELSMPVRTMYGYHLIKLFERVEIYGKVTLQHIWLRSPNRRNIDNIYSDLQNGVSFDKLALRSDDYSTSQTGGYITDATMGQLPHEYVKVLSELQEGQYSEPFQSRYGWHIVKLVKKDTLPPFSAMKSYYKQRMARDQRGNSSRRLFATHCREKYGIRDLTVTPVEQPKKAAKGKKKKQPAVMMASLDELVSKMNDSVFSARWRYNDSTFSDLRTLVATPDKEYNVLDVAKYIKRHQRVSNNEPHRRYVRTQYDNFLDSVTLVYVDSQLENEYPEFAEVVDEYRRGLTIFNYNEKMIWTKAINDSTGFANFYARESVKKSLQNPDDSLFFWRTRARLVVFTVADSACLAPSKAVKLVRKGYDKKLSSQDIQESLMKKVDSKRCGVPVPVSFSLEQIEKGRSVLLAADQWKAGVYTRPEGRGYQVLMVQTITEPCLKGLLEARGYYLSAWQNEVEAELCKSLRAKYKVKIHYDALNKITY
jgi:peptidyl-prolyl cis-trans isomerase SurA